jgi:hypothetical protein
MLGAQKRTRTNNSELQRSIGCYPLPLQEKSGLSIELAEGKLAGKKQSRFSNSLNLIKKSTRFEFSPGHQIFLIFQINITL